MGKYNDVFDAYGEWLKELGIKRAYSYKSNLKAIEREVVSKAVGGSGFLQKLYDDSANGEIANLKEISALLKSIVGLAQKAGLDDVNLSGGTYSDCKSALNRFIIFLMTRHAKEWHPMPVVVNSGIYIAWSELPPREALNVDGRLVSQDRLNKTEGKVNFPVRIINQIANNASKWADKAGLPQEHPARNIKKAMKDWLDRLADNIFFLIGNNGMIRMHSIDKIGLHEIEDGKKQVYVMLKETGEARMVMTRKANGQIEPLVLEQGEEYSHIAIDHVYRMEDILADLTEAFPFLKELTDLIRNLDTGDIRSAETRQAVMAHIEKNFANVYAPKVPELIDELDKLGKIISLEAMHKKDNLEKH